ncbi:sensor histidine kinase [Labrys wisconsinensis]|uniref:histidine kinase n=1 Tax=Labrys wisconsinensis TaxID=425677 RepID=A0ABU0JDB5_9HYPH|nr:HAMP domain-containing sensor histidine kinase [Labrys wisconsinensis]MDQ0471254.1 signal transduction histidine kinase [Labrys wisconsinensis]
MTRSACYSLRRHLVIRLVALQAAALTLLVLVLLGALWGTGHLVKLESEDDIIDAVVDAAGRDAGGGLTLRPTPELAALRVALPDLWFVVRDGEGRQLVEGTVPEPFADLAPALERVGQARLGWNLWDPTRPGARLKRVDTAIGPLQILTGPGGEVPLGRSLRAMAVVFAGVTVPILALMTLATLIATPLVVRRALAGLNQAAAEAARIRPDQRGARLPPDAVPAEVAPFIEAVNAALERLDEGYERRQRFLADAAHELRTPIAILTTRLEALPDGSQRTRLLADAARLANLAEQLLDLQRIDRTARDAAPVDLVRLARQVAADLAPLAIAGGFDLSVEAEVDRVEVLGDAPSLERALTNLVQNAIEHAGDGSIAIRVERDGAVEVVDEGEGVPPAHRRRIFEPFQRLNPRERGAGLGLHLVSEIVRLHRGSIAVLDGPNGGARFRMLLPVHKPENRA